MAERLEDTLRRLRQERDEADRRYNEALTALDRPLFGPSDLSAPPLAFDDHQMATLNEAWNTLPAPPAGAGLTRRLTGLIWRTVAPYLERQLTFNSRLVDHLNRTIGAEREAHRAHEATIAQLNARFAELADFHSRLLQFLQQITGYVDAKDRDSAGKGLVLNASLSGLAENVDKRWESLSARFVARASALGSAHDELRTTVGVSQQAVLTLKRELERLSSSPSGRIAATPAAEPGQTQPAFAGALDAYKYVGFEDQFRGSRDTIRARLESYVPFFAGATGVLDVGCGRGEFLELLGAARIPARGIDLNHEMAETCRARGLDVTEADAVSYLTRLPDASLGGLFAAQVVEHLQPGYLLRFLELACLKLRPGGRLVLETLNPACWVAFFDSYIRDITHVWPLHPDTLRYLVLASGFSRSEIEWRSPVPEQERLQTVGVPDGADPTLAGIAETFNENVDKLNGRLYTHLDYAVIGTR